jgi:iron(III) transport system permease protein
MIEQQQTAWWRGSLTMTLFLAFALMIALPLGLLPLDIVPLGQDPVGMLRDLLADPSLHQVVLRTLGVALLACATASIVAVPLALLATRGAKPTRWLIGALGVLPLIIPAFLTAALARHLGIVVDPSTLAVPASESRHAGNAALLIMVYTVHYFPVILFSLMASLARIDRSLEESARNLGAGTPAVWRRVILPLAAPGYLMGVVLVLLRILEDAATPLVLGVEDMLAPQLLLRLGQAEPSDPQLRIIAILLLLVSALFVALAWSALRPCAAETRIYHPQPARWRSAVASTLLPIVPLLALAVFALLPMVWLTLLGLGVNGPGRLPPGGGPLGDLAGVFHDQLPGLGTSVAYVGLSGALTGLVCWAFGAASAIPGWPARVARLLSTAIFAVPGVVLALAYLNLAARFGQPLGDTSGEAWLALALVVALKQAPLAHRLVSWRARELRPGGFETAYQPGATRTVRLLRVTLPALAGALGALFLLGAVAGLVELSAALLLIRDPAAPYTVVLFNAIQSGNDPAFWAAQGIALVIAVGLAVAAAAALFGGRSMFRPRQPISRDSR